MDQQPVSPQDLPRQTAQDGPGREPPNWMSALLLVVILYFFLTSIDLISGSFKLMGKDLATQLFSYTMNPFSGLLTGILATSLVQSSSTVTSLIVGLVAGGTVTIEQAVPMVMGANIGTSITNTIVSLGHMTHKQEFQRAFAGATVRRPSRNCCSGRKSASFTARSRQRSSRPPTSSRTSSQGSTPSPWSGR
jgi:hypothetical protein